MKFPISFCLFIFRCYDNICNAFMSTQSWTFGQSGVGTAALQKTILTTYLNRAIQFFFRFPRYFLKFCFRGNVIGLKGGSTVIKRH